MCILCSSFQKGTVSLRLKWVFIGRKLSEFGKEKGDENYNVWIQRFNVILSSGVATTEVLISEVEDELKKFSNNGTE